MINKNSSSARVSGEGKFSAPYAAQAPAKTGKGGRAELKSLGYVRYDEVSIQGMDTAPSPRCVLHKRLDMLRCEREELSFIEHLLYPWQSAKFLNTSPYLIPNTTP